jgi:DNA-directed RNA polymerase subunit N (RpoN/RPB10)
MNCPTCGYFLGQVNIEYDTGKDKICNNPKLSPEEKDKELSLLLLGLKLRRYCCKMRLMSYKDIVKDIIPITNTDL